MSLTSNNVCFNCENLTDSITCGKHNFNVNIYQEENKLKKQLSYANKHGFNYVLIMGENELKNNTIVMKNMETGVQFSKGLAEINIRNIFDL